MKNKEELLERIEVLTEKEDLKHYVLIADKGCSIVASDPEVLGSISMLIDIALKQCKNISKEMIKEAVKLGMLNDEERLKLVKDSLEELKSKLSEEE